MKILLTLAAGLALLAASVHAQTPPRYTVTDLGTLGGRSSEAYAINNQGEVVGGAGIAKMYNSHQQPFHAFLWRNGKMRDLGVLPGHVFSIAYGINNKSQVVGAAEADGKTKSVPFSVHAFVWSAGKMTRLEDMHPGYNSYARSINDRGQVVGYCGYIGASISPVPTAVMWQNGKVATRMGLNSFAYGINNRGQIVGKSANRAGFVTACLWQSDGTTNDLFGDTSGRAFAINSKAQAVGYGPYKPSGKACIWENGNHTILPGLSPQAQGIALAINNLSQIVGTAGFDEYGNIGQVNPRSEIEDYSLFEVPATNVTRVKGMELGSGIAEPQAVLWQGGQIYVLNQLIDANSPWYLETANGINDKGQIVGRGEINYTEHAFLLTPIPK